MNWFSRWCGRRTTLLLWAAGIQTAAAVGVELHARAGDLAAKEGERGMLASDLIGALRAVANP